MGVELSRVAYSKKFPSLTLDLQEPNPTLSRLLVETSILLAASRSNPPRFFVMRRGYTKWTPMRSFLHCAGSKAQLAEKLTGAEAVYAKRPFCAMALWFTLSVAPVSPPNEDGVTGLVFRARREVFVLGKHPVFARWVREPPRR